MLDLININKAELGQLYVLCWCYQLVDSFSGFTIGLTWPTIHTIHNNWQIKKIWRQTANKYCEPHKPFVMLEHKGNNHKVLDWTGTISWIYSPDKALVIRYGRKFPVKCPFVGKLFNIEKFDL